MISEITAVVLKDRRQVVDAILRGISADKLTRSEFHIIRSVIFHNVRKSMILLDGVICVRERNIREILEYIRYVPRSKWEEQITIIKDDLSEAKLSSYQRSDFESYEFDTKFD